MKVEETLEDDVDVEPSVTERFDKETKAAYKLFRTTMQIYYCFVYNS